MMLYKLLAAWRAGTLADAPAPSVVSITREGVLADRIRRLGIDVFSLGLTRSGRPLRALAQLTRLVREQAPDVVQTWMYHANLLGGVAARAAGVPVVWSLRHGALDPARTPLSTILTAQAGAWLSSALPDRIISCSEEARRVHCEYGYDDSKIIVIPNGFDTDRFKPDPAARHELRAELGLGDEVPVVGLVARFHPDKDLPTFARAAGILLARIPAARFIVCGEGLAATNPTLTSWLRAAGADGACHLLGLRHDVPRVIPAFDVATSSSACEAFSNTLGEAMACAVPCVATNVGDSRMIIGEAGIAVPPGDPRALAEGWARLLSEPSPARRARGREARVRVLERFGINVVTRAYYSVLREIAQRAPRSDSQFGASTPGLAED